MIILIISGSIAAQKGLVFYRLLVKKYNVFLILSKSAIYFLKNIPKDAHYVLFTEKFYNKNSVIEHVALAQKARLLIVYPASANIIAKLTHGFADDLATLFFLASSCEKIVQPAMNTNMYLNPVVQQNLQKLKNLHVMILPPKAGVLACKTKGLGRAWEPDDLITYVEQFLSKS